jgi:DNA-directed RNA polymerase subunit RPC12/RpoP
MLRTVSLMLAVSLSAGCVVAEEARLDDPSFPLDPHLILPVWFPNNGAQIAAGKVLPPDMAALDQPLPFSHWLHAGKNEIQCEYCHSTARDSVHGGVPALEVCMNCHKQVRTDSPHIQALTQQYKEGKPIAWNKVHDAPDYVHFAHNRHVRAGVNCTECHGQIQLQGEPTYTKTSVDDGKGGTKEINLLSVDKVMLRETTLQMGWCLDCHGTHPSIDKNYGDKADLRRAELKDCWTCHK